MIIRLGVLIWLTVSLFLAVEYHSLNFASDRSLLLFLQAQRGWFADLTLTPDPGRPLSLWLGWSGLTIILMTNIYVVRKRVEFMKKWGRLSNWLDFHILCGLIGPTFILFHCNFKVRGLVAISFWSMIVSATSGILGRYFYVQLLQKKGDLEAQAQKWAARLEKIRAESKSEVRVEDLEAAKQRARAYVGIPAGADMRERGATNLVGVVVHAIWGDVKSVFGLPQTLTGWQNSTRYTLLEYGFAVRRVKHYEAFQKLLGYWHSFHLPFAYFMYGAAIIHVAAALVFGVKK